MLRKYERHSKILASFTVFSMASLGLFQNFVYLLRFTPKTFYDVKRIQEVRPVKNAENCKSRKSIYKLNIRQNYNVFKMFLQTNIIINMKNLCHHGFFRRPMCQWLRQLMFFSLRVNSITTITENPMPVLNPPHNSSLHKAVRSTCS